MRIFLVFLLAAATLLATACAGGPPPPPQFPPPPAPPSGFREIDPQSAVKYSDMLSRYISEIQPFTGLSRDFINRLYSGELARLNPEKGAALVTPSYVALYHVAYALWVLTTSEVSLAVSMDICQEVGAAKMYGPLYNICFPEGGSGNQQ